MGKFLIEFIVSEVSRRVFLQRWERDRRGLCPLFRPGVGAEEREGEKEREKERERERERETGERERESKT